jgi:flavin prenyltransferase
MTKKKKVVVAIGGSSGSIYAQLLLEKLMHLEPQIEAVGVVMSDNARFNWQHELGDKTPWQDYTKHFKFYEKTDFMAPFASGSAHYETMIICPCSMGLLARVAMGISNDLTTRAADVVLKERRRLIIVPRETPLSTLHLRNMLSLSEAGAIICPAIPSFYSQPKTLEEAATTVVDRVLDLAGFDLEGSYRWGES